jgi:hypothetical protein
MHTVDLRDWKNGICESGETGIRFRFVRNTPELS